MLFPETTASRSGASSGVTKARSRDPGGRSRKACFSRLFAWMTPIPAAICANRTVSTRERGAGKRPGLFLESKRRCVFFFFSEAPNLISRLGISVDPRNERAVHFFSCAGEKTRPRKPRNERFASFAETRDGFAHRLRAFSPRRDEIIDAFSRFRRTKTREPHFAAGVVLRKNVRVGCIARRTRTLLQHSRDERIRDSRARARVRPRRAPDGHRALRRRRVPPLPPAGASPIP